MAQTARPRRPLRRFATALALAAGITAAAFTLPAMDFQLPEITDIFPSITEHGAALPAPGAEPRLTAADDGVARLAPAGERGPEIVWNGLKLSSKLSGYDAERAAPSQPAHHAATDTL